MYFTFDIESTNCLYLIHLNDMPHYSSAWPINQLAVERKYIGKGQLTLRLQQKTTAVCEQNNVDMKNLMMTACSVALIPLYSAAHICLRPFA